MAEDIGKQLQEARRSREISLEQVSKEIKIGPRYLQALEKEDYDVFPADIYVVSFLSCYARYLGLDAELLVNIYKRGCSREKDKLKLNPKLNIVTGHITVEKPILRERIIPFRIRKKSFIRFVLAIGILAGAFLLAIYYLRLTYDEFPKQAKIKSAVSLDVLKK